MQPSLLLLLFAAWYNSVKSVNIKKYTWTQNKEKLCFTPIFCDTVVSFRFNQSIHPKRSSPTVKLNFNHLRSTSTKLHLPPIIYTVGYVQLQLKAVDVVKLW